MTDKKPSDIPEAIRNYSEIHVPGTKGFKLGLKNQAKLARIRELAKRAKGTR